MISIDVLSTPAEVQQMLGQALRAARLRRGDSRAKAAMLTGVPEPTLKQFENTGQISLRQFLMACSVYGQLENFADVLTSPPPRTMKEFQAATAKPARQRGRS